MLQEILILGSDEVRDLREVWFCISHLIMVSLLWPTLSLDDIKDCGQY